MGWLIALAVIGAVGFLPVGIGFVYQASGFGAYWILGALKISLYPKPKKAEKAEKEKKSDTTADTKAVTEEKMGGSYRDFLPLLQIALDFLGDLRRKIRVKRLELLLNMAGDDPCDLAVNYGKAWAAVGSVLPQLERFLVIKKREVQVFCDFEGSETTLYLHADITITLGRLLGLLARYGWRGVKSYLTILDKRKGGAL